MVTAAKKVLPKKPSLGLQIDALFKMREKLREIQQQEKDQLELISTTEAMLMETMEAEGVEKSTGKLATASISEIASANVVDWDVFGAYVLKNKYLHLLQRRISLPGIRELLESKGKVPGVEPFTQRKLNLRKT